MKAVNVVRGLRYPDDMLVRMFFKQGLDRMRGRALELGCGNGNNLALFHALGWKAVGIDISEASLEDARWNLDASSDIELLHADLSRGMPLLAGPFDAVLFPSINYYLPRESFVDLLDRTGRLCAPGGLFYVRSRTPADWRFGKGAPAGCNGFVIERSETGEQGLLNVFYDRDELLALVHHHFGMLDELHVLHVRFENPQGAIVVSNDDIVIWGRKRRS